MIVSCNIIINNTFIVEIYAFYGNSFDVVLLAMHIIANLIANTLQVFAEYRKYKVL